MSILKARLLWSKLGEIGPKVTPWNARQFKSLSSRKVAHDPSYVLGLPTDKS